MTAAERQELLRIARKAIAAALEGRDASARGTTPAALGPGAAFVTLHHRGALRGCIGRLEPGDRLADVVADCAVSAATRDHRFRRLTPQEFAHGTEIEISVLTPMLRVTSPEEIEVGRDGLLIKQGPHSGLLLPQVATEWGWDRETFLAQTCRKAGLPLDAWKRGAEIFLFQAEIFSEADGSAVPGS
jgi:AmmeMemoRadiSam system protein A